VYGRGAPAASPPRSRGVPETAVSLKGLLSPPVSAWLLSESRLQRRRERAERARRSRGAPHRVTYFHQPDDPYSALAAAVLPALLRRYDIELEPHVVGPPDDAAAPERARLAAWSRVDAARLARRHGLAFEDAGDLPSPTALRRATERLVGAADGGGFADTAAAITLDAWRAPRDGADAGPAPAPSPAAAAHVARADALRRRLGHYLGATFHYAGEWYWGIDRLHHLERRLRALGAARDGADGLLCPPDLDVDDGPPADAGTGPRTLDFWFSLRSPYSAIAAPRVLRLARRHGATLRLRPLLPMVMRGLPVPPEKRRYIAADAAREARLHGVPFGRLVDPVGRPAERGLAVLARARREGRGEAMLASLMQGIWADGLDAGSDRGLRRMAERAGLAWADCLDALDDGGWRAEAERDRAALFERGLWGVPSFAVGDVAAWGQDRLWTIREALRADAPHEGGPR
jgi:2-hydroxychromene-2-carboxylate isomerase